MEIKRGEYLNRLIVRKHNGCIIIITDIRRSGNLLYMYAKKFRVAAVAKNVSGRMSLLEGVDSRMEQKSRTSQIENAS